MKVPYTWLKEYINLDDTSPERVAELLTLRTCEVDAVHHVGGGLDNILIGEVVDIAKHPDADTLSLTKVNISGGDPLPIVCGAPNVAKGQKIAVAPPGATLPPTEKFPEGLKIAERKIRGEVSRGMICSEKELGLGDDHDGIIVLEPDAVVGRKLTSLPSIEEWIIEIDNKSVNHRPDLWGIYGFVRELHAILGTPQGYKNLPGEDATFITMSGAFRVAIEDKRCSRYIAAIIESARVGASPTWMQRRLKLVGARPINNIVDVTNYVMFETGQPTHAFDLDKLAGNRILVRDALPGEKITTLDGQPRLLQRGDLVIADGERAVGIAGVMGGANSEVSKDTKRILLESANFHATSVRRTATRLGLRSEASARFEKSLDPNLARTAVGRIFSLLAEGFGSGARFADGIFDAGGAPPAPKPILLSQSFVESRLGLLESDRNAQFPKWVEYLDRLGIQTTAAAGGMFQCNIPSHRASKDLTEPIDLVEEIARLRGYENVVPEPMLAAVVPPPSQGERRMLVRKVEDRLVALGFRGLETYSFLSDALIQQLGIEKDAFVKLKNSIVADQSRMRTSVLPSLLGLVAKNIQIEPELKLFEVGKGYVAVEGSAEPEEWHNVAGILAIPAPQPNAKLNFNDGAFYQLKSIVAALVDGLDLRAEFVEFISDAPDRLPFIHPKRRLHINTSAGKFAGLGIGYIGEIHPQALLRLGLNHVQVAGFELYLRFIEPARAAAGQRKFIPIPRFPGISVDVALLAPENLSVESLDQLVRSADPKLCAGVALFDIYTGPELGAEKRSVAFHIELRSPDRTLTDADEASFLKNVATTMSKAGVQLRGWQG
ncbi:MAG: phenylalanine--tRNA ligase subunit beta [Planctomycetes bacterium]|nr:phenylalanine--tRNA ligase subunit beta [Planctomycetota bacterium]